MTNFIIPTAERLAVAPPKKLADRIPSGSVVYLDNEENRSYRNPFQVA